MRRAVAACTSPEVFFSKTAAEVVQDNINHQQLSQDALGLALEALHIEELPQASNTTSAV
jgi:hypothetical protein